MLALFGAIVPTILFVNLVWWLDRYEREPLWLLALAFAWGAIPAVLLVFVPEILVDRLLDSVLPAGGLKNALSFGVSPPLFEESAKGIFLIGFLLVFWSEFDDPLDGIVYGSMVGFGFALTENMFYFIGAASQGGVAGELFNIALRAGLFGLNHAFFTAWTGLALGWARTHSGALNRVAVPVLGWLTAMFFHSVHNLGAAFAQATVCLSFLIALLSDWGGILVLTIIAFMLIGREREWLVAELRPEVASGLLSAQDYEVLISSRRRAGMRFAALTSHGWLAYRRLGRFFQAATDLAFKKHELRAFGEERGNAAEISRLRGQVARLKAEGA